MKRRAVVLTISDSVTAGTRIDLSGPAVAHKLEDLGWAPEVQVLPDDYDAIRSRLIELADGTGISAVFTTGGTGIASRDVTPEATRAVLDREIPGLAECMRAQGTRFTRRALLSRGVVGTRGSTLIVNLPGSPKGAGESLAIISDLLLHVVDLLEGRTDHGSSGETTPQVRTSQH